jgi:hypothetical protein
MEQIKTNEQIENLIKDKKIKYLLWKKIVGEQKDFSLFVKKYKKGMIIEDYSDIDSEKPGECVKRYIESKNINWLIWDVFNLTEEEGELYYKSLLAKNI